MKRFKTDPIGLIQKYLSTRISFDTPLKDYGEKFMNEFYINDYMKNSSFNFSSPFLSVMYEIKNFYLDYLL